MEGGGGGGEVLSSRTALRARFYCYQDCLYDLFLGDNVRSTLHCNGGLKAECSRFIRDKQGF